MIGVVKLSQMPTLIGYVTAVLGATLVVAPRVATGPLALSGQERAVRLIGVSDLVLVPGLVRGEPRWPFMIGRAAASLGISAYLLGVAGASSSPGRARRGARVMLAVSAMDGLIGLALRNRASREMFRRRLVVTPAP